MTIDHCGSRAIKHLLVTCLLVEEKVSGATLRLCFEGASAAAAAAAAAAF